jgi:hypothetical protein
VDPVTEYPRLRAAATLELGHLEAAAKFVQRPRLRGHGVTTASATSVQSHHQSSQEPIMVGAVSLKGSPAFTTRMALRTELTPGWNKPSPGSEILALRTTTRSCGHAVSTRT